MMMWEMFTGQLPWEGSNFQDVRHAVANLGKRPPVPENLTEPVAKVGCDLFASCPARLKARVQDGQTYCPAYRLCLHLSAAQPWTEMCTFLA